MYLVKSRYKPFLFFIDFIGNLVFFRLKAKNPPEKIKKVLFIRLEYLGDMIMATPVFETFKKCHPSCEVHVLCRNITEPIIKYNPYVDKIICYDAPWFGKREGEKPEKNIIKNLKKERYDIVFEMHGDIRNNFLAYRIGSYSVGYACRGGGFFINKLVEYKNNIHTIDKNLLLIKDFCKKISKTPKIFTNKKAKINAEKIMKLYRLKKKEFIILNPRSGRKEKDLTNEECINYIKNSKSKVVITGSSSEIERNSIFDSFNVVNLTGKTDILTLAELVKNAKKVVAPDTAIVHIANAVGTKAEAIYKITDKKIWGY